MSEVKQKYYIAIDLKSFYASVESVDRGLDPLDTNLVVADRNRTEKTICLAVSPTLKAYGIGGRARLFEVVGQVQTANGERLRKAPGRKFSGKSSSARKLNSDPSLEIDFLTVVPRMARYMEVSAKINSIYTRTISPEDIHVYSIDEVFIDCTPYLDVLKVTAKQLASRLICDVYKETGITATAGIGTNLYLSKVAMDILAKHAVPDENGVRIAELDEFSYRRQLWSHRPLTSFWRVGRKYAEKLEKIGIYTMGDIARVSINDEEIFYNIFGINAELLIDHAWGWESCTIADIKRHRPESESISTGQVLPCAYTSEDAGLIVCEMADSLSLELVSKHLTTKSISLTVIYDISDVPIADETVLDYYGRKMPKQAHGTVSFNDATSSTRKIVHACENLYDRIVDQKLSVRRVYISACDVRSREELEMNCQRQTSIFDLLEDEKQQLEDEKEQARQGVMLDIRSKYGSNSLLRGMNLKEKSTARDRNNSIGGHKA